MVFFAARTKTTQVVNWLAWSGECQGKAKSFGKKETCVASGDGSEEAIKDSGLLFKAEYRSKNSRASKERLRVL